MNNSPCKIGDLGTHSLIPRAVSRAIAVTVLGLGIVGHMPTGVAQGVSGKDGTTTGTRRALIFCGHPGDAEHEEIYAAVLESLTTALTGRCRFPADQVPVWHGAKPQEAKKPSHGTGPAERRG